MRFNHAGFSDLDPEAEKARLVEVKEKFKPLLVWLKKQVEDVVRDGSSQVDLSAS
jgi:hypothetical protein